MEFDVFCIGEMVIDFTPLGGAPHTYAGNPGGAPANVAIALARLGRKSAFCGKLGRDDFGRFLLDTLVRNGVLPLCPPLTDDAVTTLVFVSLDAQGERSFTFVRKPGADMLLRPEDVPSGRIAQAKIVHAGSCSLSLSPAREATLCAIRTAHKMGRTVTFDLNYRAPMWKSEPEARRQIRAVLPYVDVLKLSEEETALVGASIPAVMQRYGVSAVVVTRGAKSTLCYHNGKCLEAPVVPVRAVDTNGCGDAFFSAFLAYLLDHGVCTAVRLNPILLRSAAMAGNRAGALCAQTSGAVAALPTKSQLNRSL